MANTTSQVRAIIWSAVSSKVQAGDDKVSLDVQYAAALTFAKAEGMTIIDHLQIPGHSRSESDILSLFDAYAEVGITAYHRLRSHWQANDFDVLIAYNPNRLGRSFSIMAFVLENVVKQGRRAYFIQGGWANAENVDYFLAMAGVSTKSDTKQRLAMSSKGTEVRIRTGLPARGASLTHRVVRDARGRGMHLEVREDLRPLFDAMAALILQGLAYNIIADQLNARGFRGPRGGKWSPSQVMRVATHPTTWGYGVAGNRKNQMGVWGFSPSHAPPPGIRIIKDTLRPIPPVWPGEQGEAIKAELIRRHEIQAGKAAADVYHLTGLIRCAVCGRRMVIAWGVNGRRYWACASRKADRGCSNTRYLIDATAKRQITAFFRRAITLKWVDLAQALISKGPSPEAERGRLAASIAQTEQQIAALIDEQSRAASAVRNMYKTQIDGLAKRLETLNDALARVPRPDAQAQRQAALADVLARLDGLWDLPPKQVNRLLVTALGTLRFVAKDGEIVGIE